MPHKPLGGRADHRILALGLGAKVLLVVSSVLRSQLLAKPRQQAQPGTPIALRALSFVVDEPIYLLGTKRSRCQFDLLDQQLCELKSAPPKLVVRRQT
jgi:hypothetical protein